MCQKITLKKQKEKKNKLWRHKYKYKCKNSKVVDCSRGEPEGSLLNSYYTEVYGWALLLSSTAPLYPWYVPYNAEC